MNMKKYLSIALGTLLLVAYFVPRGWCGQLEITLADNRKITTPYCWEEKNEIKFPLPGGTAGVNKANVISIREVVSSGQIVISEMARVGEKKEVTSEEPEFIIPTRRKKKKDTAADFLEKTLAKRDPYASEIKPLSSNELNVVEKKCILNNPKEIQKFFVANLQTQAEKNEIVRKIDKGYVVVLRNIVTTPYESLNAKPILTLFDEEGNPITEVPAQMVKLKLTPEQAEKYGLNETLNAVISVFPLNCDVSRYEISFVYNY